MSQIALVTDSNRGKGLAVCTQLKHHNMAVVATCLHGSPELDVLGVEVIEDVNVSDLNSLAQLADRLSGRRIDWLINNAGIARGISLRDIGDRAVASTKRMFEINSLRPLLTTHALLENLGEGNKVSMITSRMGSVENSSGMFKPYFIYLKFPINSLSHHA